MMASIASAKVTLCVEDDVCAGDDILHIQPTWQSHDSQAQCWCKPELIIKDPIVTVYWHNWEEPVDASL